MTHIMHNDLLEFRDLRIRYRDTYKKSSEEAIKISNQVKAAAREKVIKLTNELCLEYCFFDTNIAEWGVSSNFYLTFLNSGFVAFSFAKLFGTVIVPGTYDLSHFKVTDIFYYDTTYHELLNMYSLSTTDSKGGINFIPDTFSGDRLDKLRAIIDNPLAHKYISVCWFTLDGKNCNTCAKCMRTLVMLDYLGVLDRFANLFNIDYYNKNFNSRYKQFLMNGADIKHNLHANEKRYRELRDTVIAKHR